MNKFSLQSGKPILKIKGGRYNNRVLYVKQPKQFDIPNDFTDSDSDYEEENINDPSDIIKISDVKKLINNNKKMNLYDLKKLLKKVKGTKKGKVPANIKQKLDDANSRELILHDGICIPLLDPNKSHRIYVCGPSESGKSTYVYQILKERKPKKLFVFSDVDKDPVLDRLEPFRIKLDEELVENPISPEELANSYCIFDDVDAIQDKKVSKAVLALRDSLLTRGRHENISCIVTNHIATAGNETKKVLNEATQFVIFPGSGTNYDYLLKKYAGMDKHQIAKLKTLPSRWVCISKTAPQYVVYSTGAYLL